MDASLYNFSHNYNHQLNSKVRSPIGVAMLGRYAKDMTLNPYTTPLSEIRAEDKQARKSTAKLAIIGVILFSVPVFTTAIHLLVTKYFLAELMSASDAQWAEMTSQHMKTSVMIGAIGLLVGITGMFFILVALFKNKYPDKWFFYCSLVLAIIWCFLFKQYEMCIGLPVFIVFITQHKQFKKAA